MKKEVKVLNLNLWNYNNFEERKPKIITFIKKHNPDIVVFQEVRDDLQFNKKGNNQAKQLNEKLGYPYLVFYPVTDKRKERPEKYKLRCTEGTAILSKFPILKTEKKMLNKHKDDRYYCGNLYFQVLVGKKKVDFIAVHFSPNELFSLLHLIETLKFTKERKIKPIIIGDFNIINSEILHDAIFGEYESSLQKKKYISYPPGEFTLDYILIPKEYTFKTFKCEGTNLSDHKALITEILC
jgi:endonuclease/exonuclease/phosphatase family metal-dependent hydrolase